MTNLDSVQEEAYTAGYEQAQANAKEATEKLATALRNLLNCCQCANRDVVYQATCALAEIES